MTSNFAAQPESMMAAKIQACEGPAQYLLTPCFQFLWLFDSAVFAKCLFNLEYLLI